MKNNENIVRKISDNVEIKEIYYQERDGFLNEFMYSLSVDSLEENYVIVHQNNKMSGSKVLKEYQVKAKLRKIMNITKDYEDKYINDTIIDGKEYRIYIIYNNGKKRKIIGKNRYPEKFSRFLEIIKEDIDEK